jgi:hypothetical protein
MDKDYFIAALTSLKDFDGIVGIIGGEPTLHPQFEEFCKIFKELKPNKAKRGIWSNTGGNFNKYKDIIDDTFGFFNLNDHTRNIMHTPILVASEDIVLDTNERTRLIESCWIQNCWSATINPKGAFFCEVAGMLSYLYDGIKGLDIIENPDWWKLSLSKYNDQINWACDKCGGAIPLIPRRSIEELDDISISSLTRLKNIKSPKIDNGLYTIYNKGIDYTQIRDVAWYWGYQD